MTRMRIVVGASARASDSRHRLAQVVDLGKAPPEDEDRAVGAADGDEDRLIGTPGPARGDRGDEMGAAVGSNRRQAGRVAEQQGALGVEQPGVVEASQVGNQALRDLRAQFVVALVQRPGRLVGQARADHPLRGRGELQVDEGEDDRRRRRDRQRESQRQAKGAALEDVNRPHAI